MRTESVDSAEILRRIEEGIYDHVEFEKAMEWSEKYCKPNEGEDFNSEAKKSRQEMDADWAFVVK